MQYMNSELILTLLNESNWYSFEATYKSCKQYAVLYMDIRVEYRYYYKNQ